MAASWNRKESEMATVIRLDKISPSKLRRQMSYAASKALNDSAFAARGALKREIRREFTTRNQWTERGIKVAKAAKTRLVARVGTDRAYLVDHVTGGRRKDKAIPTKIIRRRPAQRVYKRRWPGALLDQRDRYFIASRRSPNANRLVKALPGPIRKLFEKEDRRLVFRRNKAKRRRKLKVAYVIPKKIRIKRRLEWSKVVLAEHRRTYPAAYKRHLAAALATARP